jgi:hypothetical protein
MKPGAEPWEFRWIQCGIQLCSDKEPISNQTVPHLHQTDPRWLDPSVAREKCYHAIFKVVQKQLAGCTRRSNASANATLMLVMFMFMFIMLSPKTPRRKLMITGAAAMCVSDSVLTYPSTQTSPSHPCDPSTPQSSQLFSTVSLTLFTYSFRLSLYKLLASTFAGLLVFGSFSKL